MGLTYESTNVDGRYVSNIIIGILEVNKPSKTYLLTPKF